MADILSYRLLTTTEGAYSVSTGGLNLAQIIKVARRGVQHDYVGFLSLSDPAATRAWTFLTSYKRILFLHTIPFEADEKIYVIYKTSL